jgi:hypothetical protein
MAANPANRPKVSERPVEAYLRHLGYNDICYEPFGNSPPDFLVNRRIAIEARRLNQQYSDGNKTEGLENAAIRLRRMVQKVLSSLEPPTYDQSWLVFYRFTRPLPPWNNLRQALTAALQAFMAQATFDPEIAPGLKLELRPTSRLATFFVLGAYSDRQSGGWLLDEIETNLKLCIAEKTKKIAPLHHKYPEWWLVLPDHIGWGLDDFDQQSFREKVAHTFDNVIFDKVILLDPSDPIRAFSICG